MVCQWEIIISLAIPVRSERRQGNRMPPDFDAARIFSVAGRTALVTGASSGIGAAIAKALAANGCDIALHYAGGFDARTPEPRSVETVGAFICGAGGRLVAIDADLDAPGAATRIVQEAVAALGRIDILVVNASYQRERPLSEIALTDVDREYRINFRATIELLQQALPGMAERGWGRVLSIGSVQQARPGRALITYAALKTAQEALIRALAVEYGPKGVLLNTLSPGIVATERNRPQREANPGWMKRGAAQNRLRRVSSPEDYAAAALLLCSDAGRFITGANLFATGGAHLAYVEEQTD
jgi:NAD(P)-dependent dehydrogenase (short-subunit alcohol dehydrogenase family)